MDQHPTPARATLALHACCGPCLIEPLDALAAAYDVTVVYANPNVHPREEYERRRDTLLAYTGPRGIDVVEVGYHPDAWERAVAESGPEPGVRCRACFRLRLGLAASEAARLGAQTLATTLTVSPYQDPAAIREAGEMAAGEHGLAWVVTDFRPRYGDAVRRSKELGMYRQSYCGCRLSRAEADAARAEKRARATTGRKG